MRFFYFFFLGKNGKASQLGVLTVFQETPDPCGFLMMIAKPASVSATQRDYP